MKEKKIDRYIKLFVCNQAKLNYQQNFVLSWIHSYKDTKNEFRVSIEAIGDLVGMKYRATVDLLAKLVKLELVEKKETPYGNPNKYKSLVDFNNCSSLNVRFELLESDLTLAEVLVSSSYKAIGETSIRNISMNTNMSRRVVRSAMVSLEITKVNVGTSNVLDSNNILDLQNGMISAGKKLKAERLKVEEFQKQNEELQKQIDELKKEKEQTDQKVKCLKGEKAVQRRKIASLRKESKDLSNNTILELQEELMKTHNVGKKFKIDKHILRQLS